MPLTLTTTRQMFAAEILKLRRNRPLMALAALLAIGTIAISLGYTEIRHSADPSTYGPAGGLPSFDRMLRWIGMLFGGLVAVLIGAEAGSADIASGVFRDLVATGRSRLALFAVRAPAAIAVTLALTLTGYALALIGVFAFSGGLPTPSAGVILQGAGWIALSNGVIAALAVGVGSLTGSRALTLTAVIGWITVASQLLISATSLGSARDGVLTAALGHVMPAPDPIGVSLSGAAAVVVIAVWAIVPTVSGAWRTQVRDA
jgi:ABC-type transport system involved in multi-copper enzyme maturation permease subunit